MGQWRPMVYELPPIDEAVGKNIPENLYFFSSSNKKKKKVPSFPWLRAASLGAPMVHEPRCLTPCPIRALPWT